MVFGWCARGRARKENEQRAEKKLQCIAKSTNRRKQENCNKQYKKQP